MKKGSKCVNIYINNSLCKIISSIDSKGDINVFRYFEVKLNQKSIKVYDLFMSSIL